ncbi:putative F-box/LRR-repeat protein At4g15060 [Lotus japonicus]|uniref:putative F-box/LRR-repeat protein At4g15060 n=1 Tax=Lotus japonicus TaxID=34305 RepID=UPI00258678DA|nr:putative F-box/LRR-repeat protein At4g15060 [Lotus japonicus]
MQDAINWDHKQKRAKSNNEKNCEDLINQLPNGIPGAILSKLPINEAAKTSILSRKWRYMWTFYSGTLEFDGSPVMKDMKKDLKRVRGRHLQMAMETMFDAERQTYINWTNELLSSLKSPTLQGLKFWFHVGKGYNVDKWVQFAIQKKVQKLELYFGQAFEYVLPLQMFKLAGFNSLRVLRLRSVAVTKEMLEYLLCCCPLLETLSLISSEVPETMKVIDQSLKLKCLELVKCWNPASLEIFAENLVSFKYFGPCLDIKFKSVPRLEEATFRGALETFVRLSFLPQIKMLKLDITENAPEEIYWLHQLPDLNNLKHLELVVCIDDDSTLSDCVLLLKAMPSLWRFTLKMQNTKPTFRTERKLTVESEYSIKELELVGFCGAGCEVELAMFLVQSSVELQKITIDTRLPTEPKLKHFQTWHHEENRKRALKLQEKILPGVEFVCL